MLDLEQISSQYPQSQQGFKRNILREYLQYKLLSFLFDSQNADKLSFIGGTALRIVYDNDRFSEDLGFDNFGMSEDEFRKICEQAKEALAREGVQVETRFVFKKSYRCYLKVLDLLFKYDLSPYAEEKILIQIDSAPHNFRYLPDKKILNKFDVFTRINVTPLALLLSQKIYAALERKRAKGRDFYDIVFLFSKTKPNYDYLQEKVGINSLPKLKELLVNKSKKLDFKALSKDVEPFLISPENSKRVLLFGEFLEELK